MLAVAVGRTCRRWISSEEAYQRAICVPIANVNTLWKEYDQFEMGLNKITGRKYLGEKSPAYMSAKSAYTALENITRGLRTRITSPGFHRTWL